MSLLRMRRRWGRGEETPGEDPKINGEYAQAFVTGMQGDQSSGYLKVSSCLKHYAVYSQENSRQSFPAMVRTYFSHYLAPDG